MAVAPHPIFSNRKVVFLLAALCGLLWGSSYPAINNGYALFAIAPSDIAPKNGSCRLSFRIFWNRAAADGRVQQTLVLTGYPPVIGGTVLVIGGYAIGGRLSGFTFKSPALLGCQVLMSSASVGVWAILLWLVTKARA